MNNIITFLNLLVYMSPVILMVLMLGNAVMSGTPITFLIYLGFLYVSGAIRAAIYYLGNSATKSKENVPECVVDNYLYTPIAGYKNRLNLSTFLFAFTLFYMFFPGGNFYLTTSSQLTMFIIIIIYAVYDIIMRSILNSKYPECSGNNMVRVFKILYEVLLGSLFGFASSTAVNSLGMGNYLYFSKNKNTPTKKVFRCGAIKK